MRRVRAGSDSALGLAIEDILEPGDGNDTRRGSSVLMVVGSLVFRASFGICVRGRLVLRRCVILGPWLQSLAPWPRVHGSYGGAGIEDIYIYIYIQAEVRTAALAAAR